MEETDQRLPRVMGGRECDYKEITQKEFFGVMEVYPDRARSSYMNLQCVKIHRSIHQNKKEATVLCDNSRYEINKLLIQSLIPQLIKNYVRNRMNTFWESTVQHSDYS